MSYTGKFNGEVNIIEHSTFNTEPIESMDMGAVPIIQNGKPLLDKYGRQSFRRAHVKTMRSKQVERYHTEIVGEGIEETLWLTRDEVMNLVGKKTGRRLISEYKERVSG